jgi:hypothetical protein
LEKNLGQTRRAGVVRHVLPEVEVGISVLELCVLVGLHVVIAHQVGIRADADMLDTDEFDYVVDVVDDILDGRRLAILHEIANAGYAHDATLTRELF